MAAPARREDGLRLVGSSGANRVMEAELLRLVKRSPFEVRVPRPRRDGDSTLLYDFTAPVAWVAAAYHRSSSRVEWDLASSPASRLEPLFADLVGVLAGEDRLGPGRPLRLSVEVGAAHDFEAGELQLRGAVKNALVESLGPRGFTAVVDAEHPELVFVVRRGGPDGDRRTIVGLDLGGGARHRRGHRAVMTTAPLRETLAAQLVLLSRWDARTEPLVDPMAGGGTIVIEAAHLAVGHAVRRPSELPLGRLPAFADLPRDAPDLFTGTAPRLVALDADAARVKDMVGNLRSAGLTGPERESTLVLGQQDIRALAPDKLERLMPGISASASGVFAFNPPYGHRMGTKDGGERLIQLYGEMGIALRRFPGWRVAVFVANEAFLEAFGGRPSLTKPASNAELRGAFHVFEL